MRFLHTADWHVGKTIRGRSRADEFASVLDEIVGIASQEGVDAVLIAGDVYEHRAPPPEADLIAFEAFVRLHEAGIPAVAVAGNHDSPVRLEALSKLLSPIGVRVVPRVMRPEDGGVVEVASRDGSRVAAISCVPFVAPRRFGDAAQLFDAPEGWFQSYAEGMGGLLSAYERAFRPDRVNVVVAHLFTDGALLGGGEREVTIGMDYAVSPARLPATAAYLALGHVHRPQTVRGAAAPARYAGSPLQLDFGEVDQRKSVAIVDASPGKPSAVRTVELTAGRRLVDLRGTLDELVAQAGSVGDAYVRAFVSTDGPVPGIAEQVREALPNAVDVHLTYERAELEDAGPPVSSLSPREQFLAYYRHEHAAEPSDDLVSAFDEVLAGASEGA
jgi:exonuclease SbcD